MRHIAAEFKRAIRRTWKHARNEPLALDDISVIKSASLNSTHFNTEHYEAYRNHKGTWNVDHVGTIIESSGHGLHVSIIPKRIHDGQNLTLKEALNLITILTPEPMRFDTKGYNRPANVAKMIDHTLPGQSVAPASSPSPSKPPAL